MDTSRYRILEKVNAGGMAEIYRAEMETMPGFRKIVAIKRIKPVLKDEFLKMFLDEARLSLYLQHANIVSVFDVGQSGEHFFIVMEYIEGVNLRQVWQGRHVPMKVAVFIISQVLEALHYAHNAVHPGTGQPLGVVHRDVTPQNILLSLNGDVKLVDFGLAKASVSLEKSQPGQVKGKYSYLAPELLEGYPATPRSDIFSTGIVLWELLTGRRLFKGASDMETLKMIRQSAVPAPSHINPDVPVELDRIVLRALAKNPDERYESASDFGDVLTEFLFSHGLKVGRGDVARLVSDVRASMSRSRATSHSLSKLKELVEGELASLVSVSSIEINRFADTAVHDSSDPSGHVRDYIPGSGQPDSQVSSQELPSRLDYTDHNGHTPPDLASLSFDEEDISLEEGPSSWIFWVVGIFLFSAVGYALWYFFTT